MEALISPDKHHMHQFQHQVPTPRSSTRVRLVKHAASKTQIKFDTYGYELFVTFVFALQ